MFPNTTQWREMKSESKLEAIWNIQLGASLLSAFHVSCLLLIPYSTAKTNVTLFFEPKIRTPVLAKDLFWFGSLLMWKSTRDKHDIMIRYTVHSIIYFEQVLWHLLCPRPCSRQIQQYSSEWNRHKSHSLVRLYLGGQGMNKLSETYIHFIKHWYVLQRKKRHATEAENCYLK